MITKSETEQTGKKLILASADWCGPCYGLKKRIERENLSSKVEIKDMGADVSFFEKHNIKSVPTLVITDGENNVEFVQGVEDIFKAISKGGA